jgi:hypothetical protein
MPGLSGIVPLHPKLQVGRESDIALAWLADAFQ